MTEPAHVLITGAAGQIGYILSHWIAGGELFGKRPVILHLLDLPVAENRLTALTMELQDCAFDTLAGIVATTEPGSAYKDVDVAFLVASKPLLKGQVRADLIKGNSTIFKATGIPSQQSKFSLLATQTTQTLRSLCHSQRTFQRRTSLPCSK